MMIKSHTPVPGFSRTFAKSLVNYGLASVLAVGQPPASIETVSSALASRFWLLPSTSERLAGF